MTVNPVPLVYKSIVFWGDVIFSFTQVNKQNSKIVIKITIILCFSPNVNMIITGKIVVFFFTMEMTTMVTTSSFLEATRTRCWRQRNSVLHRHGNRLQCAPSDVQEPDLYTATHRVIANVVLRTHLCVAYHIFNYRNNSQTLLLFSHPGFQPKIKKIVTVNIRTSYLST